MRLLRPLLLVSCLLVAASPAFAYVAQTITVDGVNDFEPSNLVRDDRYDTQRFFCSPDSVFALDIGRAFVTNDNNFLYIGFDWPHKWNCYDKTPKPNLGIAIDVNTPAGGVSDPWSRQIGWANLANKPDFIVYDVPKNPEDTYHFQVMYKWTGTAWGDSTRLVNGTGSGPNALGMVDTTGFVEFKLPLSALGVTTGSTVNLEWWYTQDGANKKGPLDAVMSSAVQMSHFPSSTTWDTTAVVQMTAMAPYTVLAFSDVAPPTVSQAVAASFTLLANKQFSVTTNKIDVTFSEPVELTSAQTAGNYAFSGPVTRSVILATRDPAATNVVHLLLNSAIGANAAFYGITVSNVKDLSTNTIVANGTTNVGSFFVQNLVFDCDPGVALCKGVFTAADTFAVEGSLAPLTFASLCDNALMYDLDANSVWETTVPFAMPKNAVTGKAEADFEYKYSHQCGFEGGANRSVHLSSDNGASVTLTDYWNRENPADFTAQPVDVVFQVNAARISPTPADTIYLQGGEYPLSFTPSGIAMKDDGVAPDLAAGDAIYTAKVRFPKCATRNIEWKTFYRGAFECLGQGNRTVWLNDAAYDTVGGTLGALWLPARGIERCSRTDKPVTVVFKVSMLPATPLADTVAVMGSDSTLVWERPLRPGARMNDAGTGFDQVAGDHLWTTGVTFPDSTNLNVEFKFWHNGFLECFGMGNRTLTIDDVLYSTTTPQVRVPSVWDYCSDATADVPAGTANPDANAAFAILQQSFPNPMSPRTTIRFDLKRAGEASLTVYDVTGRRVATLLRSTLQAGPHDVQWDGRDDHGNLLRSGVYLYELAMGKDRLSRRIALMR
jgi:hypothetical protein